MKIAIFHNFMDNIGGAERVGLLLARELKADFFTTNIDEEKIKKMGFSDINLHSIGTIPVNAPFRQQAALHLFRKLNVRRKYDFFIIDGDWAMSGAVNNKPNLWYVHSPIREIWDLYHYTRKHTVPWFARPAFDGWVMLNRHLNRKYVKQVDTIVCNSNNTRRRVKKYLKLEAQVINPPIETSLFHYAATGNYWLSVNRLITHKRVDLQMKAFACMPDERLVIVGSYEKSRHFKRYAEYIKELKPENVEIMSWVDQEKLVDLYANCKGFLTTSHDEDFGMTPLEAMASGKPVIAPDEGGYKETVIDGTTGVLLGEMTVESLVQAVKKVGGNSVQYKDSCITHARQYDTGVFIQKIKEAGKW